MSAQSVKQTQAALRITILPRRLQPQKKKTYICYLWWSNRCDKTCGKVHIAYNDVRREVHHYCVDKNCKGCDKLGHIDEMPMESDINRAAAMRGRRGRGRGRGRGFYRSRGRGRGGYGDVYL